MQYIAYDPAHAETYLVPFSVYLGGREIEGAEYAVADADTGEELEFFYPSGLAAQTYILRDAQPGHSYLVTMSLGDGGATEQFIFGIRVY